MAKKITPQLLDLTEEVGKFIEYWGFKRIHGKIWALLYVSKEPLAAADFMEAFGISKALASISIRDLLKYEVILEKEKSSYGTQLYVANPEIFDVITGVLRQRELKMLAQLQSSHGLVAELPEKAKTRDDINPDRLKTLGEMITEARGTLSSLLGAGTIDFNSWKDF